MIEIEVDGDDGERNHREFFVLVVWISCDGYHCRWSQFAPPAEHVCTVCMYVHTYCIGLPPPLGREADETTNPASII